MKLYVFDEHRIGVLVAGSQLVDITYLIDAHVVAEDRMTSLIANWDSCVDDIREAAQRGESLSDLTNVVILPPQPRPRTIVAAPVNYRRHQAEMGGQHGVYPGLQVHTIETYAGFIKASTSITGPSGAIELPFPDRRFDHEAELGVVIGRTAKQVSRHDAHRYVFGYVPLLDITMRGPEDRSYRKSFDTFTPIGPCIVTADEVQNSGHLDVKLTVKGEVRQQANTSDLIYDVPRLIELYSEAMTLQPGDIIASGTPEGVGPIEPGDEVVLTIETVGELTMRVTRREPAPPQGTLGCA